MPTSIHLKGGLGNQLFQIFTAIAYACKNKHRVVFLNVATLGDGGATTQRPTYWTTLFKALRPFLVDNYTQIKWVASIQYDEPAFTFAEIPPYNPNYMLMLSGYFQSPRYFHSHAETIIRMLNLKDLRAAVMTRNTAASQVVGRATPSDHWGAPSGTVSLHIRLGDYKKYPKYHPIMPVTYYVNALRAIHRELLHVRSGAAAIAAAPLKVLCFYDTADPDDVKTAEHICFQLRETFFETDFVFEKAPTAGMADWEELLFMSACTHHVIANSSFSWWGAYLARQMGGIAPHPTPPVVCYPDVWFGTDAKHNTADLFPDDWRAIPLR